MPETSIQASTMPPSHTPAPGRGRRQRQGGEQSHAVPAVEAKDFSFSYGATQALKGIDLVMPEKRVTALIGPSGCGKSTFLRSINRMNDLIPGTRHDGDILIRGASVYDPGVDVVQLRKRVGMVFQKSNPFPKSIYDNVAYGARVNGIARGRRALDEIVERSLGQAALWDE